MFLYMPILITTENLWGSKYDIEDISIDVLYVLNHARLLK